MGSVWPTGVGWVSVSVLIATAGAILTTGIGASAPGICAVGAVVELVAEVIVKDAVEAKVEGTDEGMVEGTVVGMVGGAAVGAPMVPCAPTVPIGMPGPGIGLGGGTGTEGAGFVANDDDGMRPTVPEGRSVRTIGLGTTVFGPGVRRV